MNTRNKRQHKKMLDSAVRYYLKDYPGGLGMAFEHLEDSIIYDGMEDYFDLCGELGLSDHHDALGFWIIGAGHSEEAVMAAIRRVRSQYEGRQA